MTSTKGINYVGVLSVFIGSFSYLCAIYFICRLLTVPQAKIEFNPELLIWSYGLMVIGIAQLMGFFIGWLGFCWWTRSRVTPIVGIVLNSPSVFIGILLLIMLL